MGPGRVRLRGCIGAHIRYFGLYMLKPLVAASRDPVMKRVCVSIYVKPICYVMCTEKKK